MNQRLNMNDRLSFRSPLRRTSQIKKVENPDVKIVIQPVVKEPIPSGLKNVNKSSMNQRGSAARSPKVKIVNREETYKIVTKTPSGGHVKVPEPIEKSKFSFVKFVERKMPMPIKQEIITEYIKINSHKKYKFDDALLIYENNQTFYLEQIQDDIANLNSIIKNVTHLEQWFNCIKEPKPTQNEDIKEWEERCEWKIKYGYSKYFNTELLLYTNYHKD